VRNSAGKSSWYRIATGLTAKDEDGGDTYADVYVYDEIGFWGTTAQDFIDEIRDITDPQINLHLNSPGGEVFDGIAIYNAILSHPANVTTYVDALAASIASVIAMGGDEIIMGRNSQMMIHDALGLTIGNEEDHLAMAKVLARISDNIAAVYMDRAGGEVSDWRDAMRAETWYSAQEAVDAGLADKVSPKRDAEAEEAANKWDLSIFSYAGRDRAPAPGSVAAHLSQPDEPAPGSGAPDEPAPAGPFEFDADMFRAVMDGLVKNRPAPPAVAEPEPQPDTSDPFVLEPADFANAIREAARA
jgi:ATP-dependent protease ClpP protease subunit